MSSGISGTYQAAVLAAQELQEAYPGRTVRAVDSKGAGLGTGLLTLRAADLRDEGLSAVQAADTLDGEVQNLCQYFTVDDLMFLRGTGRLSTTGALMGTLLGVKPILWGDETGHIVVHSKCRGRKKSVETLAQIYARKAVSPGTRRVAISHGDCPEDAQALADLIRAAAAPGELIICPHEPFTGSHVGPGMLGLFFFGDGR
ncbi:MAG: DegV family protein [Firmicutes bacterium]|nr:DegV family protein [Bacillota bacterium]